MSDELKTDNRPHFRRSDSIAALAAALAKSQGQISGAAKDSANPFFKSRYADLSSVWEACRAALAKNELAVMQFDRSTDNGVEVETLLAHSSGEWVSETLALPVAKKDAQGIGSALTYARRYALSAMVGVAPDDDDGNAASRVQKSPDMENQQQAEPVVQKKPEDDQRVIDGWIVRWQDWIEVLKNADARHEPTSIEHFADTVANDFPATPSKAQNSAWKMVKEYAIQRDWSYLGNFKFTVNKGAK